MPTGKHRLRVDMAIANLPPLITESVKTFDELPLESFAQARYPKGHPKGGQFKPKNGGAAGQDSRGKVGPLSRAKAAIADKLMALAGKLGLIRPKEEIAPPKGLKLPKGYKMGAGRPGTLAAPIAGNRAEEVVEKGDLRITHSRQPMQALNENVLALYSEIDSEKKSDPNFSEVHSTMAFGTRKPGVKVGIKGLTTRVVEYSFEVDGSLNQSEYSDPAIAREIMNSVRTDFFRVMGKVSDNEIVAVSPWNGDGKGKGREAAYRRMGFGSPNKKGYMAAVKMGDKLYPVDQK